MIECSRSRNRLFGTLLFIVARGPNGAGDGRRKAQARRWWSDNLRSQLVILRGSLLSEPRFFANEVNRNCLAYFEDCGITWAEFVPHNGLAAGRFHEDMSAAVA